jgi:hypothetical protein
VDTLRARRVWFEQVVGWRLVNQGSSDGAGLKLQCDWNLKDSGSVHELYARIAKVAEAADYEHEIQTLESTKVRVEVWTPAIGVSSSSSFFMSTKTCFIPGAKFYLQEIQTCNCLSRHCLEQDQGGMGVV